MQLELGSRVDCSDEAFGKLVDVAVAQAETDVVALRLTKDEVPVLPPVEIRRWPRPGEHGIQRR